MSINFRADSHPLFAGFSQPLGQEVVGHRTLCHFSPSNHRPGDVGGEGIVDATYLTCTGDVTEACSITKANVSTIFSTVVQVLKVAREHSCNGLRRHITSEFFQAEVQRRFSRVDVEECSLGEALGNQPQQMVVQGVVATAQEGCIMRIIDLLHQLPQDLPRLGLDVPWAVGFRCVEGLQRIGVNVHPFGPNQRFDFADQRLYITSVRCEDDATLHIRVGNPS